MTPQELNKRADEYSIALYGDSEDEFYNREKCAEIFIAGYNERSFDIKLLKAALSNVLELSLGTCIPEKGLVHQQALRALEIND